MDASRIRQIEALPEHMRDHALVDPETVAAILNTCIPTARKIVKQSGLALVEVNSRRHLPRWGDLRDFLKSREKPARAAA